MRSTPAASVYRELVDSSFSAALQSANRPIHGAGQRLHAGQARCRSRTVSWCRQRILPTPERVPLGGMRCLEGFVGGLGMQRTRRPMQVRLCAYPAYWLKEYESFANKALRELVWSTGAGVRPGDVQIFCVDDNLDRAEELADDPQVGAVHSLWQATTRALSSLGNREFPVQAKLEVL